MRELNDTKKWRELLRNLRRYFPARYPIRVWRYPAKKCFGLVRFDGKKFLIRIDGSALPIYQRDALIHEWAHCLCDDWVGSSMECHSPVWGVYYAMIYSGWVNDFKEPTQ